MTLHLLLCTGILQTDIHDRNQCTECHRHYVGVRDYNTEKRVHACLLKQRGANENPTPLLEGGILTQKKRQWSSPTLGLSEVPKEKEGSDL